MSNWITEDFSVACEAMEGMCDISREPCMHWLDRAFGFNANHIEMVYHGYDMLDRDLVAHTGIVRIELPVDDQLQYMCMHMHV